MSNEPIEILTIETIRERMNAAGSYWWTPDTMAYFGTKVMGGAEPIGANYYFITEDYTGFDRESRGFTVRRYNAEENSIHTVGQMTEHGDIANAHAVIEELRKGLRGE